MQNACSVSQTMSSKGDTLQDAEMVESPEASDSEQVVLINGAATGIGLVTALAFATRDFRLALLDQDTDKLSLVAKKCHEKSPKGYKVSWIRQRDILMI